MAVAGLDLSLSCTGVAVIHQDGRRWTRTVKSKGTRADTLDTRATRLNYLAKSITHGLDDIELAVIESPSFGSGGSGTWDRSGLWWLVVQWLYNYDIPVAMMAPTTLKKFACGTGTPGRDASLTKAAQAKAGKEAVRTAMRELFPDLELKTLDESDALTMALCGAFHLGYVDIPLAPHQTTELTAAVKWPTTLEDE